MFANGPGDRSLIPGRVIPKTQKMVLDSALLSNQHYKVRIKGKVEQSKEWSSALPTPRCSSYWKENLRAPSTKTCSSRFNSYFSSRLFRQFQRKVIFSIFRTLQGKDQLETNFRYIIRDYYYCFSRKTAKENLSGNIARQLARLFNVTWVKKHERKH